MDARETAFYATLGYIGADDAAGGMREGDRLMLNNYLLGAGVRPVFAITGPYQAAAHGAGANIWVTDFAYSFHGERPWLPDQLMAEFRRQYDAMNAAGRFIAPNVNIVIRLQSISGPRDEPYPTRPSLAGAQRHADQMHMVSVPRSARNNVDWVRVQDFVNHEDHYDEQEEITAEYGNRMSRIVITVQEFRIPGGAGMAADLGIASRALAELPYVPDGLCGQACLAYALASRIDKSHMAVRPGYLCAEATKVAEAIGVPSRMVLTDFDKFTEKYPTRTVVVLEGQSTVLYRTVSAAVYVNPVYLLLHKGHYLHVNDVESFAKPSPRSRARWCHSCCKLVAGALLKSHACEGSCYYCKHAFVSDEDREAHYEPDSARCPACNFSYRYAGCRPSHRCKQWLCLECNKTTPLKRRAAHVCGETYCYECDEASLGAVHRCFVLPVKHGHVSAEIWAYDTECTLDPDGGLPASRHNLALVVAMKLYTRETVVFRGAAVEQDFLRWVEAMPHATTLIAHNAASYDTYLVLEACRKHKLCLPQNMVVVGSKIPFMQYKNVRFIDSMRHMAGSLAKLAKTFDLPVGKGFFPYRFYTAANRTYVGDVPANDWFEYDQMDDARKAEFGRWAGGFGPGGYSVEDEAIKYCRLDAEVLCLAMEAYRDAGIAVNEMDPLQRPTIASYALAVFRANHMEPKAFPILTRDEYDFVRRGLFGGRTDVRQVYRAWTPEQIASGYYGAYADVCSMYPTVQKYDPLPVGAPWWNGEILGAEACHAWLRALADSCAMVECTVECPRDLYHPVLLEKREGRLVAALDITGGVFTSVELLLATRHGYRVTSISRALCSKVKTGVFASYVDQFIATKQRHAKTGEEPNPGKCALAKIMLNSLWGKLGQRDVATETRFHTSESTWFRAVCEYDAGRLSALDVHDVNDDYVFATATEADAEKLHLRTTDMLMAAFVTASARVRLYAALAHLGERVIYHDTDSVIYEHVPDLPDMPHGTALGEWKDELDGRPMDEFVGLGPKTYAYRVADGESCVKSKGFATGFTLEDYRELAFAYLLHEKHAPLAQSRLHFVRARLRSGEQKMTTQPDYVKKLVVSLQKVHVASAQRTLPFGHAAIPAEVAA